jgi:predicted  nucleic acid-binding Zn-ribbon protein
MPDRVSVDRKEFESFLAENQELVGRYQELLGELNGLRKINRDLEEKLRLAEQKLAALEKRVGAEVEQADEALRNARATMTRLTEETDRRISE